MIHALNFAHCGMWPAHSLSLKSNIDEIQMCIKNKTFKAFIFNICGYRESTVGGIYEETEPSKNAIVKYHI